MRVLVTGGAGNIGQEVVDCLLRRGDSPVILDRAPPRIDKGCPAHVADIGDRQGLTELMQAQRFDGVIHLASMLQYGCEGDPQGAVDINVQGTMNLLEACRVTGVKRLSFASSIAVYGSTTELIDETRPIQPDVGIYGASKLLCERILRRYRLDHGLQARTVRFSTVLSSRPVASPGIAAAVAKIMSIASGKDAEVGEVSAEDLRHYIYYKDAAAAAVLTLYAPESAPDTFNVAGAQDSYLTFSGLVDAVREMRPNAGRVRFGSSSGHRGRVDTKRAAETLGYSPAYSLREALVELLD